MAFSPTLVLCSGATRSIHSIIVQPHCNKIPIDLWHFRLVHPTHQRLQIMKQTYSYLYIDYIFSCNTCHHAKQRKLSFPLSNSHTTAPFELLHMDI